MNLIWDWSSPSSWGVGLMHVTKAQSKMSLAADTAS